MNRKLTKILLLHALDKNIQLIKETVLGENDNYLFIVAKTKDSFFEKINWTRPNLIISDLKIDNFTGKEALQFAKQNHKDIPFVFTIKKDETRDFLLDKVLDEIDGWLTMDDINKLPTLIHTLVLEKTKSNCDTDSHFKNTHKSKVMLHKAETILENGEDFLEKKKITELIKSIQKNM